MKSGLSGPGGRERIKWIKFSSGLNKFQQLFKTKSSVFEAMQYEGQSRKKLAQIKLRSFVGFEAIFLILKDPKG